MSPTLPKVGDGAVPSPGTPKPAEEGDQAWWPTSRAVGKAPAHDWATGEMERFRRVPVVGHLPWRAQYTVAALGLILGVLVLAGMIWSLTQQAMTERLQQQAEVGLRQAVADVDVGLTAALRDPDQAEAQLASALAAGGSAAKAWREAPAGQAAQSSWNALEPSVEKVRGQIAAAQAFRQSLQQAHARLSAGLAQAGPSLAQLRQSADGPGQVGLWQAVAGVRAWDDQAVRAIEDGARFSPETMAERSTISAGVRTFASSSQAQDASAVGQAWRSIGQAWAESLPAIDRAAELTPAWNALNVEVAQARTESARLASVLDTGKQAGLPSSSQAVRWGAVAAGLWTVACLALLIGIGWKQQRWQALAAAAAHEQIETGIMSLMTDLSVVSQGDLTRRSPVSESTVGTLADMLNNTFDRLSGLVKQVKQTADKTVASARDATDATTALVDAARDDQVALVENGREVLRLSQGVQHVARLSEEAKGLSDGAVATAQDGQKAVGEAADRLRDIREYTEEAGNRVGRLATSSKEIANIITVLNDLADQINVIAMQAGVQAALAGDGGRGFKVVADNLEALADKSGNASRRISALIETALGDIEAASSATSSVLRGADDGARLMDVSREASASIAETIAQLAQRVEAMREGASNQEQVAHILDVNTKTSMERVASSQAKAQAAAEGILNLLETVRALGQSAHRFRV